MQWKSLWTYLSNLFACWSFIVLPPHFWWSERFCLWKILVLWLKKLNYKITQWIIYLYIYKYKAKHKLRNDDHIQWTHKFFLFWDETKTVLGILSHACMWVSSLYLAKRNKFFFSLPFYLTDYYFLFRT